MTFVIAVHTIPKPFAENTIGSIAFKAILFMCNGLFYMLSGCLNLDKVFESKEDYVSFYKNKIVTILLPFILGCIFVSLYTYEGEFSFSLIANDLIYDFLSNHTYIFLWFVYPLIGMLLSTPFLSKMLHSMSDWELKLLFGIGMGWQVASIYFANNLFGVFGFSGWFLSSWVFHFFIGYFIKRIVTPNNKYKFYIFSILGFFVTVLGKYFLKDAYTNPNDLAPAHILLTMGLFILITEEININNTFFKKIVHIISSHSFSVYLVHDYVKNHIVNPLNLSGSPWIAFSKNFILTLFLSVILAIVIDTILIRPLQKIIRNILK